MLSYILFQGAYKVLSLLMEVRERINALEGIEDFQIILFAFGLFLAYFGSEGQRPFGAVIALWMGGILFIHYAFPQTLISGAVLTGLKAAYVALVMKVNMEKHILSECRKKISYKLEGYPFLRLAIILISL